MVPFERALVRFYRPSIVTFPLSLRVSEILPLLFSSMTLFPYPTPIRAKMSENLRGDFLTRVVFRLNIKVKGLKPRRAVNDTHRTELRDVTCHMGSHSVLPATRHK